MFLGWAGSPSGNQAVFFWQHLGILDASPSWYGPHCPEVGKLRLGEWRDVPGVSEALSSPELSRLLKTAPERMKSLSVSSWASGLGLGLRLGPRGIPGTSSGPGTWQGCTRCVNCVDAFTQSLDGAPSEPPGGKGRPFLHLRRSQAHRGSDPELASSSGDLQHGDSDGRPFRFTDPCSVPGTHTLLLCASRKTLVVVQGRPSWGVGSTLSRHIPRLRLVGRGFSTLRIRLRDG